MTRKPIIPMSPCLWSSASIFFGSSFIGHAAVFFGELGRDQPIVDVAENEGRWLS